MSDMFQQVSCLQLSASIIADRYILTGYRTSNLHIFFGLIFIIGWYMESLIQVVMSVNRCVVIIWNKHDIFTFQTTMIIFVFLISFNVFCAMCTQFFFPCCAFITDHATLSFGFVSGQGVYSYSNLMIFGHDCFCTTTSTLCYIAVFQFIRKSSTYAANSRNQKKQDVRYLLQFVFISLFYVFTWISFEILPHVVPDGQTEWYLLCPVFATINCTSNSIIYMAVNSEIQKSLKGIFNIQKISVSKVSSLAPTTMETN